MKKIPSILLFCLVIIVTSCGSSQKDSKGNALTAEEEQFLNVLTSKLSESGCALEYYEFHTGPKPVIFSDEMDKSVALVNLNKFNPEKETSLINSLSSKYLKEEAQKRLEQEYTNVDKLQERIKNLYEDSFDKNSKREFMTGLFTITLDNGYQQKAIKTIGIIPLPYDKENFLKNFKSYDVNEDLIQKATILTESLNGTLLDYEINLNQNLDSLSKTTTDPILKFILEPIIENSSNS